MNKYFQIPEYFQTSTLVWFMVNLYYDTLQNSNYLMNEKEEKV